MTEEQPDLLMFSTPAENIAFALAGTEIATKLQATYLADATPADIHKEFIDIKHIQVGKSVCDVVVGYGDKLKHVFFILNEAATKTVLRDDVVKSLIGDAEVPKDMEVTINGFLHRIIPTANLISTRPDLKELNILGDDFIQKYCHPQAHAYEGSPRTHKLHFNPPVKE